MAKPLNAGHGRFVTFEGGEGAGKSTQVRLLATALREAGIQVTVTREPGGSPGAEDIRGLLVTGEPGRWEPVSEALLLYAARRDHWVRLIEPALKRGDWVISDRFADSTLVYQGVGRGVERAWLDQLHRLVLGDVAPDLTVLLDLPAETGLARTRTRDQASATEETRFERMTLDFHQSLRRGFAELAAGDPARIVSLDASGAVDEVAKAALDVVWTKLAKDLPG
ncbi:MAG: dTMP kinase [Proteobacteria bacterium]|nr:dTMP kinase [Pseudomonadota bacterium]